MSPKVIVDTTGAETRQQYDGPVPQKGLYKALFKRGWWTKTKDGQKAMLKVLFILDTENEQKKQFNGYAIFHNVTHEASTAWKMQELFTALKQGKKSAIDFDDKGEVTRIGRAVPGKTWLLIHGVDGSYKGEPRLEVGTLAPLPGDDEDMGEETSWDDETAEEATGFDEAVASVPADAQVDDSQEAASDGATVYDEPPF